MSAHKRPGGAMTVLGIRVPPALVEAITAAACASGEAEAVWVRRVLGDASEPIRPCSDCGWFIRSRCSHPATQYESMPRANLKRTCWAFMTAEQVRDLEDRKKAEAARNLAEEIAEDEAFAALADQRKGTDDG